MICLHTVKWFKVLTSNTNYSIQYHSFAHSQMVPIIAVFTNNLILTYS